MTAFTIEVLLLLALAFLLGLAVGFKLGRRAVPTAESGAPPVATFTGRLPVHEAGENEAGEYGAGERGAGEGGAGGRLPPSALPFSATPSDPGPHDSAHDTAPDPVAPRAPLQGEPLPLPPRPVPAPREPDLFSRLGLSPNLASLPPEPEDEPLPLPLPPPPVVREKGPDGHPGVRPPTLDAPEGEGADDLKLLKGIGPQNERRLNALGIFHIRQIAAWTPDEAAWVGSYLAFPGRIERENWIGQARALAAGAPPPEPGSRRRG
ncbi:hypothetical protein [Xanthobacter versatilis]|uniref:hypothetical protein n=1 Tax=Xanthobacter autotrophicus (strain ATCC BAA-1158 / Py2) TaxID=78245 RepID=UPI00372CFAD8